jgi:hypothetical protein
MSPFRTMMTGLMAASLATPAFAQCMQPAEKPAFEIRALQSQLMVLALTCNQTDDYNRFVIQHRAVLGGAYNDVARHFRRVAGGAWQRQIDAYITNTANGHSQVGISQGSLFCSNQAQLFPAALAVNGREGLATLSEQRQIAQVYTPPLCGTGSTGGSTRSTTRASAQQPARTAQPARSTAAPRS